jgi:hypothetical protein
MCGPDYVGSEENQVRISVKIEWHSSFTKDGKFLNQLREVSFSKNIALLSEQI